MDALRLFAVLFSLLCSYFLNKTKHYDIKVSTPFLLFFGRGGGSIFSACLFFVVLGSRFLHHSQRRQTLCWTAGGEGLVVVKRSLKTTLKRYPL